MAEFIRKGLSFPFRISVKGGVTMSKADSSEVTHIIESMQQAVRTRKNERCMEYEIYSEVDKLVWDLNDATLKSMLIYLVKDCLSRLVNTINVIDVEVIQEDETVLAIVSFTVKNTGNSYATTLELGGVS